MSDRPSWTGGMAMSADEWRSGLPSFDEAMDRIREHGRRVGVVRPSDVEREMTRSAMLPPGVERRPTVQIHQDAQLPDISHILARADQDR